MKHLYLFLAFLFISYFLQAQQPGSLDNSFGTNGTVTTQIQNSAGANAVVVQADGKVIAAGSSYNGSASSFAIAKYNTNGTLDNTFGTNGIIIKTFGTYAVITTMRLQADGKIIVGGQNYNSISYYDFTLIRYNTNGTPDNTFGTGGIVTTSLGTGFSLYLNALTIQTDGKIVAAGYVWNNNITKAYLTRYNSNGSLDNTFGTNGKAQGSLIASNGITSVTLQNDGKIVAGGFCLGSSGFNSFMFSRFNTNGTQDNSFGINGVDTMAIGTMSDISAVALQSDGKIIGGGKTSQNGTYYFQVLVRLNTDGTIDNTFSTNGKYVSTNSNGPFVYALAVQSDDKILIGGYNFSTVTANDFAVARFQKDGSGFDNTFGSNGVSITNVGGSNRADQAYAMQLSGSHIYLAGYSSPAFQQNFFAVAAYNNDGFALPVTFLNFDGALQNNEAILKWSTAYEMNNKGFDVQRSLDGRSFTSIGFVAGSGNSSIRHNYTFSDAKLLSGSNYYRLQQTDFDGRLSYSSVIKLEFSRFSWAILGNPSSTPNWVQLQLDKSSQISIQIISLNGNILQTINKGRVGTGTYSIPLNLENAASGMYVIKLTAGDKSYVKTMVK